ncbi:MAG TPA: DJ-1/PfpI family protein [Acholeplasmataceae bacterium]|jgi:4-methyl-5(b-hydroxyethyl)-thiazole monophosphate biosynthesis|nr:DJ-1/PfpI family protein [Acholeplasmataceae bacterium]
MKGIVILANGFEDTEAIATIDVLKRSKLQITTVSFDSLAVTSAYNIQVQADMLFKNLQLEEYDFLVIPGGRAVFNVLNKKEEVSELIKIFMEQEKLVAAICAAPMLIGKLGYLKNRNYTCFPTCEEGIEGNFQQKKNVVRDGNIITAKAMAFSLDFALEIIEYLQGKKQRDVVYRNIRGES